ncbi:MAG: DUF502 domain-containing protein [Ramlibacter sp.]|nr:DUF502 domain-containing protein [Ramlibacter sp.]
MKITLQHPVRTLLTGALALLPLAATALVLAWIFRFLSAWLGPESVFGRFLTFVGLGVTQSEAVGYLLGVVLLVACVYVFGLLVEAGLQRGMARLLDALVRRIPVVRTIYDVIQKLVALLAHKDEGAARSMSPVWLHFGGKDSGQSTAVLGLLSTAQPVMLGGKPYVGVLVPTAPVPVGGGLLYVPPEWVEPAQVGMEGLTSIYVSMGVTSGQYLDKADSGPV